MLHRNCLLKHVIEGQVEGKIEGAGGGGGGGRRRKQLLDDFQKTRRYWKWKEETVVRSG